MRVLVACEFSGTVRDAFIKRGHYAMSCDLLPADGRRGPHYQGDVADIIGKDWDLMIAHPPCTYLCSSGLHWNKRVPGRSAKTEKALEFVESLLNSDIPKIALENPIGCISTRIRKYDQKIQPWQFGHDARKATCLWLKGLDPIHPTKIVPPKNWALFSSPPPGSIIKRIDGYSFTFIGDTYAKPVWSNQTPSGQNKLGPSDNRWAERSKTYSGIAEAMANQWG